jgi:hypothetical protein
VASNATMIGDVSFGGSIRELDPATGAVIWNTGLPDAVYGSPSLNGAGVIALATYDEGPGQTAAYLIDASNGSILKTISTSNVSTFAQPVFADEFLFVATIGGKLTAYKIFTRRYSRKVTTIESRDRLLTATSAEIIRSTVLRRWYICGDHRESTFTSLWLPRSSAGMSLSRERSSQPLRVRKYTFGVRPWPGRQALPKWESTPRSSRLRSWREAVSRCIPGPRKLVNGQEAVALHEKTAPERPPR